MEEGKRYVHRSHVRAAKNNKKDAISTCGVPYVRSPLRHSYWSYQRVEGKLHIWELRLEDLEAREF